MASPIIFGQGLAGSGIDTATVSPDYFGANVIWVNSATGSDANAGTEPELPLATVGQAVTNASAGSVIALAATHAQTISSTVTVNKAGLKFVGFGLGTARATFTPSSGATVMFNIVAGGDDCSFENVYFKAAAATSGAAGRVASVVKGTEFYSCTFDCGAFDQECLLFAASADYFRVDGCTFTATGSRPTRAIAMTGTNIGGKIIGCTVDGSTFGWAGNAITVTNCTRLYVKNLTLAGNADMLGATTVSYQMFGVTTSSAGKVTLS